MMLGGEEGLECEIGACFGMNQVQIRHSIVGRWLVGGVLQGLLGL